MKHDCDVCRGSRVIRVPLFRSVSVTSFSAGDEVPMDMAPSSREYPCPECAKTVDPERIAILEVSTQVVSHINDPEFLRATKKNAAHRLVDYLCDDFIEVRQMDRDYRAATYALVATIGVVSKSQVATMEERIAKGAKVLASKVIEKAAEEIDNWGSFYNHNTIGKSQAIEFMREALARSG